MPVGEASTVTDRPTADFDHHSREFHENRHREWDALRQRCPVAHNPRYGGFWVVSGYPEVAAVARDAETYSSRHQRDADDGIDYLGIAGIPRSTAIPTSGIAEVEGPVHQALRRALNAYLVPAAVARLEPLMEATTTWFLDQHIASGEIDLVLGLTSPVPAIVTLELIGLPCDGWERHAELFHGTIAHRRGSPEFDRAVANIPALLAELHEAVIARRHEPRDDLLTAIIETDLDDGRHLSDDEVVAVLWNLVGGGLDTTTSLTALALHHLDGHRDQRRRLIDEPDLLAPATEEFLRYFSVNETLTRTVTADAELGGQGLRRGDHLMVSWLSANRDEAVFPDADSVVIDRTVNPHLAFGVGPHRCIGLHLARSLFRVMMRQVLDRLPDYEVDHDATRFYEGNPELHGVVQMPATFTPGPVRGPAKPPF
jgi:cytochrome P450